MKRQHQLLLICATLGFSWLAMQAVHELGHVLGAIVSGGQIERVVLYPTAISYTQLTRNPHPLFVAWLGPLAGVALPAIALLFAKSLRWRGWYVFQFFAGFCLVANGAYLAFGSLGRIGDAGDLMRHGASLWLLWLFGVVTISIGLWLWNGIGTHFGFGASSGQVDRAVSYTMAVCLLIVVTLELMFSSPAAAP